MGSRKGGSTFCQPPAASIKSAIDVQTFLSSKTLSIPFCSAKFRFFPCEMSITKFSVYKTKILLFKSIFVDRYIRDYFKSIFVDRYISVYLYYTIANMLFNLETNVLRAKLVNM